MRKYYQAALAVTATLSVIALLFYRHEYYRLRYVLEVFTYFGSRGEKPINCTTYLLDRGLEDERERFSLDGPTGSWQRINDDVYVYSAYLLDEREIRAVGVARAKRLSTISCRVYYENEMKSSKGDFFYAIIESSSWPSKLGQDGEPGKKGILSAYHMICKEKPRVARDEKRIVGVSFLEDGFSRQSAILSVKNVETLGNYSWDIALCVAPASKPILRSDFVNFLSFHNALGIRYFLVYDSGIPETFTSSARNLSHRANTEFGFYYASVPWNFPFNEIPEEIARRIVEAECRLRSYRKAGVLGSLSWDEYLVMRNHRSLLKLFKDTEERGFLADRYRVSSINYCGGKKKETEEDDKFAVLGSKAVDGKRPVYLYRSKLNRFVDEGELRTRDTTLDVILVNRYEKVCAPGSNPVAQDDLGKFSKSIESSQLYKLLEYGH